MTDPVSKSDSGARLGAGVALLLVFLTGNMVVSLEGAIYACGASPIVKIERAWNFDHLAFYKIECADGRNVEAH